jgi:hypothetical protein
MAVVRQTGKSQASTFNDIDEYFGNISILR